MAPHAWTDLGGGVRVRRSAAFQMNSTVLLDAAHAVLVDPGVLPSELDAIAREVAAARPQAVTLVFTHGHWDHVLGRPWWPEAQTIAHDRFAAEVQRDAAPIQESAAKLAARHGETWERSFTPFRPDHAVSGLHFTKVGPWRLVLRDAPGHSQSQLSLHLPDHRILIAADMLSDVELPSLEGPCEPYRRTLEALWPLAEGGAIQALIPGHGAIARGREAVLERLRRDLSYLQRLEVGVAGARQEGLSIEQAQERLSGLEYGGRRPDDSALEEHRKNVASTYRGLATAPGKASRKRRA
jgi:glyoxylase-like metal-dependent hydrolase (beta-lactamase superfamily II)